MEQKALDRALRALAVVLVAIAVVLAIATPAGLTGSSGARPRATESNQGERTQALKGTTAAASASLGYAFLLSSQEHEYPARWCRGIDIGYAIDFTQAVAVGLDPDTERARWQRVFRDWSKASKGAYRFHSLGERFLGTTFTDGSYEIDIEAIESETIGITYVYGDPEDAPNSQNYVASAVEGRTAGNGGLQVVSRGTSDDSALVGDRGFVMIDASDAVGLAPNGLRHTLYTHEVGHALGLGHVEDTESLMHGTLSESRLKLADGDLEGIGELSGMPCSE